MKKFLVFIMVLAFCLPILSADRSPQWRKVRLAHLKLHPVCEICGSAKDVEVHHFVPFHLDPKLELEESNLITLCESKYWGFSCHLQVGHGGNYRYENKGLLEDVKIMKKIASPGYIRQYGTKDRDDYLVKIKQRVKAANLHP